MLHPAIPLQSAMLESRRQEGSSDSRGAFSFPTKNRFGRTLPTQLPSRNMTEWNHWTITAQGDGLRSSALDTAVSEHPSPWHRGGIASDATTQEQPDSRGGKISAFDVGTVD